VRGNLSLLLINLVSKEIATSMNASVGHEQQNKSISRRSPFRSSVSLRLRLSARMDVGQSQVQHIIAQYGHGVESFAHISTAQRRAGSSEPAAMDRCPTCSEPRIAGLIIGPEGGAVDRVGGLMQRDREAKSRDVPSACHTVLPSTTAHTTHGPMHHGGLQLGMLSTNEGRTK